MYYPVYKNFFNNLEYLHIKDVSNNGQYLSYIITINNEKLDKVISIIASDVHSFANFDRFVFLDSIVTSNYVDWLL
jgi:hypothetical protein